MIMNIGSTPKAIGRTAPEIVRSSSQKNHHPSHLVQTVLPVPIEYQKNWRSSMPQTVGNIVSNSTLWEYHGN